ncbi:hypothetical protein [Streptomyces turgidiscabies]|uniref:Integral membrane protein n=1 Tax=Streptomyces turgidiscabies TaxID=85558 RepID=A0ABU0RXH1_9ACTN|nr:hypothetical protein [Streptomyces turgidiscabies]MDQ0936666.1 hypothetical protein [Streptomyces turgidiscabies]
MTNTSNTAAGDLNDPTTREAFETVKKCVKLFGAVCGIVLATTAVVAVLGGEVTAFMWVRGGILLAMAPVILRLTASAAQGSRSSFERVRILTTVLPIAIIVVDLIPGLCPGWYAAMQAIGALGLLGAAVITRRAPLRSAFAKSL